jgi:hypothetical protein
LRSLLMFPQFFSCVHPSSYIIADFSLVLCCFLFFCSTLISSSLTFVF